jgi:hypothetical protein
VTPVLSCLICVSCLTEPLDVSCLTEPLDVSCLTEPLDVSCPSGRPGVVRALPPILSPTGLPPPGDYAWTGRLPSPGPVPLTAGVAPPGSDWPVSSGPKRRTLDSPTSPTNRREPVATDRTRTTDTSGTAGVRGHVHDSVRGGHNDCLPGRLRIRTAARQKYDCECRGVPDSSRSAVRERGAVRPRPVTTPTAARTLRSLRRSDCTRFGPVVRAVSERARCISCRLLKRDVTPAVAVFAATNDAVYDLLRPFVLFYVSGTPTVSTVLSSRHRSGNIRLAVNGRSTHDGFVATHRRIVPQSEVGHPTGYPVNKRDETRESPPFELNDGRRNYLFVLTTPPCSTARVGPYREPNSSFAGSHGSPVLRNRLVGSSKHGRTV